MLLFIVLQTTVAIYMNLFFELIECHEIAMAVKCVCIQQFSEAVNPQFIHAEPVLERYLIIPATLFDSKRLINQKKRISATYPQPQVIILATSQVFIKKANIIKQCLFHHDRRHTHPAELQTMVQRYHHVEEYVFFSGSSVAPFLTIFHGYG